MPEHNDLLRNALAVDRLVRNQKAELPLPKSLFKHEEDDFGSNDNNREAAKRLEAAKSPEPKDDGLKVDPASVAPVAAPVALTPAPKSNKLGKTPAAPVWNSNA